MCLWLSAGAVAIIDCERSFTRFEPRSIYLFVIILCAYDISLELFSFSWAILLIVIAFHSCLYSLVAILIQESYVLSFAHVPTIGHGSAQFRPRVSSISATGQITSATGQLNRPRVSSNSATGQNTFGHGSAKWHCHGTICYWHGLSLCLRSIQKRMVLRMVGTKR